MLVALEHIQNRGGEKHGPVARLGFGRRHYQFALYPVYLPFYPQRPGAEVQVIPMERQDLAPAQAGGQLQQQKLVAAVFLGLNQQALDLLGSKYLHFSGFCGREFTAVRRVAEDQFFFYRLVQGCVESGVDAPDGLVGQALAIELGAKQPAVFLEIGVESLNFPGGQLV